MRRFPTTITGIVDHLSAYRRESRRWMGGKLEPQKAPRSWGECERVSCSSSATTFLAWGLGNAHERAHSEHELWNAPGAFFTCLPSGLIAGIARVILFLKLGQMVRLPYFRSQRRRLIPVWRIRLLHPRADSGRDIVSDESFHFTFY
jgi:hypothetical protein